MYGYVCVCVCMYMHVCVAVCVCVCVCVAVCVCVGAILLVLGSMTIGKGCELGENAATGRKGIGCKKYEMLT